MPFRVMRTQNSQKWAKYCHLFYIYSNTGSILCYLEYATEMLMSSIILYTVICSTNPVTVQLQHILWKNCLSCTEMEIFYYMVMVILLSHRQAIYECPMHWLTPEKGVHQFRYFLLVNTYCCLLMHECIFIKIGSNAYTITRRCTHWIPFQ